MKNNIHNANIGNTYKLVPVNSVLQDIYRVFDSTDPSIMSEDNILEAAYHAAHQLYNYKYYQESICVGVVNNYNIVIPDYQKIHAVYWKQQVSDQEVSDVIYTTNTQLNDEGNIITNKLVYDYKTAQAISKWELCFPKHSLETMINMNIHEDHKTCESCNITYSVKGCLMTLSKYDGYVLIIYKTLLRDDDGNLLIPFVPEVFEAIKNYVIMEIHQRLANSHREGSFRLFEKYEDRWFKSQAAARLELLMLDLPEWISMSQETNKLVQGTDNIERHLNSHNGPEHISLGRPYYRSY
jgi:hypothetical protein